MSQLPEGAVRIKTEIRKVFDQISLVIEHDFEVVTYRTKEGKLETAYFPFADDKQAHIYKEVVPGTHITAGMLSQLAFDCHQMSTPVNRELIRFTDLSLKTCRQTLINWLWKGGEKLNLLIPALKEVALEEGANANCDETDGYNVYTYLDKEQELINIEHICCWAHARHKFKLAYEQGSDNRARIFLELIGQLYGLEKLYKAEGLTAEEIKARRNCADTCEIIAKLASNLHEMNNIKESLGDLMQKAVNYLQSFWKQLMAWRNDGNYSIDNNIAERSIRPITLQRKSSLLFGSSKGSRRSLVRIDNPLTEKERCRPSTIPSSRPAARTGSMPDATACA